MRNIVLLLIALSCSLVQLFGQSVTISGPTSATQYQTKSYALSFSGGTPNLDESDFGWTTSSGNPVNVIGDGQNADVIWEKSGTQWVAFEMYTWDNYYYDEHTVNVGEAPPQAPPAPTVTSTGCGSVTLQRSGTPPSGTTWYWQKKTSNGTSVSMGSGPSITFSNTTSGNFYLRAKNGAGWGGQSYRYASIPENPPKPTANNRTYCGSSTISLTATTGYDEYRWYLNGSSTYVSSTSSTHSVSTNNLTTYKVKVRDGSCWSGLSDAATVTDTSPNLSELYIAGGSYCQGSGGHNITVLTESLNGFADFSSTTQFKIYRDGNYVDGFQASDAGTSEAMTFGPYTVLGGTSDTYTLTVKKSGCSEVTLPQSTSITENSMAVIAIDEGVDDPEICAGDNFEIYTNSSSAKMYSASSGGSILGSADASGKITSSLGAGTYWVGLPPGSCVNSIRVQVQVNEYPPVGTPNITSGVSSRCQGSGTTDFNVSISNASSYNWSINPASAGTINSNGTVTWLSSFSGTVTVNVTAQDVCGGTSSANRTITVNPLPTVEAGGDMTTFVNSPITLSGQSPIGGEWSGSGVSGDIFTNSSLGDYTLTYTYDNGNDCSDTDTRILTVVSVPVITLSGSSDIYEGESVTLSVPSGYNYQWQKDLINIPGATSRTITVSDGGSYRVHLTNSYGATAYTGSVLINLIIPNNENYVMTWSFKEAGIDPDNIPDDVYRVNLNTTYFDGLGRPKQKVGWQSSPEEKDLVEPIIYDQYGRNPHSYLPYADGQNGWYKDDFLKKDEANYTSSKQYQFYQGTTTGVVNDNAPYSQMVYEPSPLNRVTTQYGPGEEWSDKGVTYGYEVNTPADGVKIWEIDANDQPEYSVVYGVGELTKNVTADEQGYQTIEFTNKLGQVELKRVQANDEATQWADTYYIYGNYGNLLYVLPPEANSRIDGEYVGANAEERRDFLDKWAFQYKYDHRNRMKEKKVPGAGRVFMVYDNRDRLVLTQDGNQREDDEWLFTKYDALNRPVSTGVYVYPTNAEPSELQGILQAVVNDHYNTAASTSWYVEFDETTTHGYTDRSFPTGVSDNGYLTVTYYDDYAFKSLAGFDASYDYDGNEFSSEGSYPTSPFSMVKGQVTGNKIKVLDGSNTWLKSVSYYDNRYRVIQTVSENYGGTIDRISTLYNFSGWVLATFTSHESGGQTIGIKKRYVYDHTGRLMKGYHEIYDDGTGHGEVLLAENKYNELGELIEKNLHIENGTAHQSVDYRYNIRGWLERVNTSELQIEPGETDTPDLFGMKLLYNSPLSGVTTN